jgi:hypothetical protein
MANPFTIEIFATSGDPAGIRVVTKTNWSGAGIVFPRELTNEAIKEDHAKRPGVYVLVGDLAEETVYVGEADPVSVRLKQQLAKDWSWGVFFVDSHGLGKTEVQYLESELVKIAQENRTSIVLNRNVPTKPNMSRQSEAMAAVFLSEILLILPIIGVRAFSKAKTKPIADVKVVEDKEDATFVERDWDTIVVPAKEDGFRSVFLDKNCWYAVRIAEKNIRRIQYIAAYQVAPVSAVTHMAEIEEIVPYQDSGKMIIKFKAPAKPLANPVNLREGKNGSQPQASRYTSRETLLNAKYLDELWL